MKASWSAAEVGWRLTLAVPVWLGLFGLSSHVLILCGASLSGYLFPVCAGTGIALSFSSWTQQLPAEPRAYEDRLNRWIPWICIAVLTAALGSVVVGALATPPRSWDGFASWELRARYYAPGQQAYTQLLSRQPAVYIHSRSYPLLQPLCLGASQSLLGLSAGRLFFPLLFAAFIALVGQAGRRCGMPKQHAWLLALCFGTTPMWLSTGSGAVDSGYAELFLAYALGVFSAGAQVRSAILIALGAFLLPLIKPEALVYAAILCTTLPFVVERRLQRAAVLGFSLALLCWIPLADQLMNPPPLDGGLESATPNHLLRGLLTGTLFLVPQLVFAEWIYRCRPRARTVLVVLAAIATVLVAGSMLVLGKLAARGDVLAGVLYRVPETLPAHLGRLPSLVLGYLEGLTFVRKYGMVFVITIALLVLPRRYVGRPPSVDLAVFLCTGVTLASAGILLTPAEDIDHEFKSRYDRLLLHWVGVAWLLVGPWLSRLLRR